MSRAIDKTVTVRRCPIPEGDYFLDLTRTR